eukprot:jgi/Mesvir1/8078/Mv06995-RA.1
MRARSTVNPWDEFDLEEPPAFHPTPGRSLEQEAARFQEDHTIPYSSGSGWDDADTRYEIPVADMSRRDAQVAVLSFLQGRGRVSRSVTPTRAYEFWNGDPGDMKCDSSHDEEPEPSRPSRLGHVFGNTASTGYNHMAMVSPMPRGSLWNWIVVWQAAPLYEGTSEQHFLASFSDDARGWSPPIVLPIGLSHGKRAIWAPVLHLEGVESAFKSRGRRRAAPVEKSHRHKEGDEDDDDDDSSDSDGPEGADIGGGWGDPDDFPDDSSEDGSSDQDGTGQPNGHGNQQRLWLFFAESTSCLRTPLEQSSGLVWVLPVWSETPSRLPDDSPCALAAATGVTTAGVLVSRDGGKTWSQHGHLIPPPTMPRARTVIEGTLAVARSGALVQLYRSRGGWILRSVSTDGGRTWSEPAGTVLPNPNSKVGMVGLQGGGHASGAMALALNDDAKKRRNLVVARSRDGEGEHWRTSRSSRMAPRGTISTTRRRRSTPVACASCLPVALAASAAAVAVSSARWWTVLAA